MKEKAFGKVMLTIAAATMVTAMTGCGSTAEPEVAGETREDVKQITEAMDKIASVASSEQTSQEAEPEEVSAPEYEVYESKDGWSVRYNPDCIAVNEADNFVGFVYTGECAGTNMVSISYTEGKQPQEVLGEITEAWGNGDEIERFESYCPGTSDKWAYWVVLPSEGGSGLSETAIASEYNGGVLLFENTAHMSGDDAIDIAVSDQMALIVDSIQYKDFEEQTMLDYVAGTYSQEVEDGFKDTITLNHDHTGMISFQDDIPVTWSSIELIGADFRYEYTIEGDILMVNIDDVWREFTRE